MKKFIFIGIILALLLAGGLAGYQEWQKPKTMVDWAKVKRKDLAEIVQCSGTIEPQRQVDVSANTMGTILALPVAEGQMVAEGDLLMEIDPSEFTSAVQALEATIRSAKADLVLSEASLEKARQDRDRNEALYAQGLVAEEALATARTNAKVEAARVDAARHRIAQHRANLDKARHDLMQVTITAPMSGLITRLNVEQGENVIMGTLNNPGTVLLTIVDLSTMEAWVEVDETEVVKLELGQKTMVTMDAFPDQEFSGTVTEIGNSPIQTSSGSTVAVDFEVKITLQKDLPRIRPGLTAKAEIEVATREQALAVPLGAVTVRDWPLAADDIEHYDGGQGERQQELLGPLGFPAAPDYDDDDFGEGDDIERKETEGVFILVEDLAKFVPVKLGIAGDEDFELIEGLDEDQVIVSGPFRVLRELKDGTRVAQRDDTMMGTSW